MPATEICPSKMTTPAANNDAQEADGVLLQRYFRSADHAAMNRLFERHAGAAYRVALEYVGNSADAEEVVQTAFLQILLKGNGCWEREHANVRGWIMSIVVNSSLMKIREEERRRKREDTAAGESPQSSEQPADAEVAVAAVRTVKSLPMLYRLPIMLHFMEGFSVQEVSRALSRPEKTVHSQISRGLEEVRQSLAAAGMMASVIAISELLPAPALPPAPVALTSSFKAMIASAATAKGVVAVAATKAAVTVALLLASSAVVVTAVHFSQPIEPKGSTPTITPPVANGVTQPQPKSEQTMTAPLTIEQRVNRPETTKYLNMLLMAALQDHASEIRVDVEGEKVKTQYLKDGKLIDIPPPKPEIGLWVCDRIRVMADMDLDKPNIAQNSRIELTVGGILYELEVVVKPADGAQHITMKVSAGATKKTEKPPVPPAKGDF